MESMGFLCAFGRLFRVFENTGKNCQHSGNLLKTSFFEKMTLTTHDG